MAMITVELLTELFGWASIINIAIFLFSTLAVIVMRKPITGIHSKLFGLEEKDLPRIYFQYLGQFKIAILVLNIAPYIALKLIV